MKILNFNLALLLTAMLLIPFTGRGENPAAPDFAFPDKVEKTASADLKAALRDGDGKAVVNAVIRLGLAKSIVNQDSLPDVLARISALSASEKDPATAALLNSLSATIYTQVYSADSWQYNNRECVGRSKAPVPSSSFRFPATKEWWTATMPVTVFIRPSTTSSLSTVSTVSTHSPRVTAAWMS